MAKTQLTMDCSEFSSFICYARSDSRSANCTQIPSAVFTIFGIAFEENFAALKKLTSTISHIYLLFWLVCGLLTVANPAEGQVRRTLTGKVIDASNDRPLSRAKVRSAKYSQRTDAYGWFTLDIVRGERLIVTAAGYQDRRIDYADYRYVDSLTIYISSSAGRGLNTHVAPKAENVYQKDFENVLDYAFLGDTLVVLAHMDYKPRTARADEAYLRNTINFNLYGKDFKRITLPDYVRGLYHDPLGGLWVMGNGYVLEVQRKRDDIHIVRADQEKFRSEVLPMKAVLPGSVFYSEMMPLIPHVTYKVFLESKNRLYPVRYIRNEQYFKDAPGDFRVLEPWELEEARKLEKEHKIDEVFFAPYLRTKVDKVAYDNVVTHAFDVDGKLVIYDVFNGWIYHHDNLGQPVDSMHMYHHKFDGEKYLGMLQDRYTGKCYSLHSRGGSAFIRHIKAATGGAGTPIKLRNSFPENVRVYNGYVYYTYREPNTKEFRKLMREKLP